jgi:nitrogen fixation/metabolism regulation signal transduction histidine kinase
MCSQEKDEQKAQYVRAIFDGIPSAAFVVDQDVCIQDFNTAAEHLLGPEEAGALNCQGGRAFHCLNAEGTECGKAKACKDCAIRNSVRDALLGQTTHRKLHKADLRISNGIIQVDLLVSASLLPYSEPPQVLLILENLTEIVTLHRLMTYGGRRKETEFLDRSHLRHPACF